MTRYEVWVGIRLDDTRWSDVALETSPAFQPNISVEGDQYYVAQIRVETDSMDAAFDAAEAETVERLAVEGITADYELEVGGDDATAADETIVELS